MMIVTAAAVLLALVLVLGDIVRGQVPEELSKGLRVISHGTGSQMAK
jgi:hypothetical protein